eukprot:CAMPEP_0119323776 /NCGR_PEP_ID=MMETSP1333-20130426/61573_1 /TAXON_ID=418940 /ORGANISM="Scyphosphaera apsteinii, Strain RCC1455" /LENGTH=169 /DNA_ID=CAMNT_0007331315 /DNA_START=76 /DNA_END=585 /DNA_ORIENTATION=-
MSTVVGDSKPNVTASRRSLQMPDIRSVTILQEQILTGLWQPRHLDALVDAQHTHTRQMIQGILTCSSQLFEQQQHVADEANSSSEQQVRQQQQKINTKNLLCLCNSTCPEQTRLWLDCVRKAAKALKENHPPPESCVGYRRRLERCAQGQTSTLLHAALLPPNRDDATL